MKKEKVVKFLVAEDEPACRSLFVNLIKEEGFDSIAECEDGRQALSLLERNPFDLILTDLSMPCLRGDELIKEALALQPDLTVLVISGQASIEEAVKLVKKGVFDFLSKPFNIEDFKVMIKRALNHVEVITKARHQPILASLLKALERKDLYLKGHSERVAELAVALAQYIKGFTPIRIRLLQQAAIVHDLGKIGISEEILNKAQQLQESEWKKMRKHPIYTVEIIEPIEELKPCIPFVKYHHERYDGGGYPEGLKGEKIPEEARIISVADTFDAMNSDRAYRKSLPYDTIISQLEQARGSQLDPGLTDLFLQNISKITGTKSG